MNAQEILKVVEENMTVEEFAYGDYPITSDFTFSPETTKIRLEKEAAYEEFNSLNSSLTYQERDHNEKLQTLRNKWAELPNYYDLEKKEWLASLGLGSIEEVEQVGGEGEGDTWYSVKYFKDHGVYIKTDGFYSSYNGTDFYEGYGREVKPEQKTITVFQ